MKHRFIYMLYMMILFSAISWRVTRASSSFCEIKAVNISELVGQTIVTIDLTKSAKAIPYRKNKESCIVLDFDDTVMSSVLTQRAYASRDIKLAYLTATENAITVDSKKDKAKKSKHVKAKFFFKDGFLPSVKFADNQVILKLTEKELKSKTDSDGKVSNQLVHPAESKYSPVVVSIEDAPFLPVVTEIASQAGIDLCFGGKLPEKFSIELQSNDPFEALCSIAEKANLKFFRDGFTWRMEGQI